MTRWLIIIVLAVATAACASMRQDEVAVRPPIVAGQTMPGALEPIYAAAVSSDQAVFRVTSNGCTDKADIQPVVVKTGADALITLRRVKDDRCDDIDLDGIEVIFSLEELGLVPTDRIEINNPYLLAPDVATAAS